MYFLQNVAEERGSTDAYCWAMGQSLPTAEILVWVPQAGAQGGLGRNVKLPREEAPEPSGGQSHSTWLSCIRGGGGTTGQRRYPMSFIMKLTHLDSSSPYLSMSFMLMMTPGGTLPSSFHRWEKSTRGGYDFAQLHIGSRSGWNSVLWTWNYDLET